MVRGRWVARGRWTVRGRWVRTVAVDGREEDVLLVVRAEPRLVGDTARADGACGGGQRVWAESACGGERATNAPG
eukprot:5589467-Prymnesium_polylepis.1